MENAQLMYKAFGFASGMHSSQLYGDKPYVYHLEKVVDNILARAMKPGYEDPEFYKLVCIGWLHDVIEDTSATYHTIDTEFGPEIAMPVWLLTKREGQSYEEYMEGILGNRLAREVKICDTWANLEESLRTGNDRGLAKYPRQLKILIDGVFQ